MMTQDEMQAFVDRRIAAVHQFLTTETCEKLSQEQQAAFDEAAVDLGVEFLWNDHEESGTFGLRMIGLINGLLARNDQTLMMQYDENGNFIGLKVADRTRFGVSVEAPPDPSAHDEVASVLLG